MYNNRLIVSKPYTKLIMNGSALNFADLLLVHVHFHRSTTLRTDKINHVTSDTRPSCFSACNIEKLEMGLRTRLPWTHIEHQRKKEKTSLSYSKDKSHSLNQLSNVDQTSDWIVTKGCGQIDPTIN